MISPELFAREIAPARTFGFLKDTQRLQAIGLARGGSLSNAIVLDETRVLNTEGLRFRDEFARHKILDLIGDLALLGVPLQGHVKAVRGGHKLHQALVAEIRANPSCWTLETPSRPAKAPCSSPSPAASSASPLSLLARPLVRAGRSESERGDRGVSEP